MALFVFLATGGTAEHLDDHHDHSAEAISFGNVSSYADVV